MRSAIITSLIIFLAALAGGYCILWYSQANNLRSALERSIDQINNKQQLITYESVALSGFPWRLEASIMRPHFKGRMNSFVRPIGEAVESTLGKPIPKLVSGWDEDLASDGKIVFSVNMMANFYTLTFTGNWQHKSTVLTTAQATYIRQEGQTGCTMEMESGTGMLGMLWNFQAALNDFNTFFSHFRILNCRSGGISVTDSESREALASIGAFSSSITHDPGKSGEDEIHYYSKVTDLQTTPQGDNFVARYAHELSPYDLFPTNFSMNGKQNSEVDVYYNGPITLQRLSTNPNFHFSVNNFDLSDDLHTHHFKLNMEGSPHSLNLSLNSELKYSELFDKEFPAIAFGLIRSIDGGNLQFPILAPVQRAFLQYTPEQVYSIIYPSLFKPSAFGTINSVLNASYLGAPFFAHGALSISGAKVSTKHYGLAIEGTSDIDGKALQTADFVVICNSCMRMADDFITYLNHIQPTIQYFAPETAHMVAVMTADPENVKKIITSLANHPVNPSDPMTLRFVVSGSSAGGITIGHKTIAELLPLLIPIDTVPPAAATATAVKNASTATARKH